MEEENKGRGPTILYLGLSPTHTPNGGRVIFYPKNCIIEWSKGVQNFPSEIYQFLRLVQSPKINILIAFPIVEENLSGKW